MTDRHIDDEALDWAIRMAEPALSMAFQCG